MADNIHAQEPCEFCDIDGRGQHAPRCPVFLEAELAQAKADLAQMKADHYVGKCIYEERALKAEAALGERERVIEKLKAVAKAAEALCEEADEDTGEVLVSHLQTLNFRLDAITPPQSEKPNCECGHDWEHHRLTTVCDGDWPDGSVCGCKAWNPKPAKGGQ